jgi:hypothetical protein
MSALLSADALALGKPSCTYCSGYGRRSILRGPEVICACVWRAVFRACYRRFRECAGSAGHINGITLARCGGPSGYRVYSRKREEFAADFVLLARRSLGLEELAVFNSHFLLGADWRLCCRQMHIDRGAFFHLVYAVEVRMGRVYAECDPYSLFPVAGYFVGVVRKSPVVGRVA